MEVEDYRRFQGAWVVAIAAGFVALGLPPLARGLVLKYFCLEASQRNTAACAGLSVALKRRIALFGDYRRSRGAWERTLTFHSIYSGLPPLARGLANGRTSQKRLPGITAARAGFGL